MDKLQAEAQSLSNRRTKHIIDQISAGRRNEASTFKVFGQHLASVIITRVFIMAPIERMKIIMQVKNIAQFVNPSDKPKNIMDLSNKISLNQGIFSFYRGANALIYKLILQNTLQFALYESVFQSFKAHNNQSSSELVASMSAASFTALVTTLLTYPLDLAHGRMAADMSKKPSNIISKNIALPKGKLYNSVRDCISRTQEESGVLRSRKYMNMFKGIQSAMIAQVPYTMILMGSFEAMNSVIDSKHTEFKRQDEEFLATKMFTRFGASTLSLFFAQTLCYPLDTIKRRMQLNGSTGHKNIYKSDWHCLQKVIKEEGVYKGLYSGYSLNLIKCTPIVFLQFIIFQNLRFMSDNKKIKE